MFRHPDVLAGAVTLALGAALGLASFFIDINPNQTTLTARFVPLLIASILTLCGGGIIINGLRSASQPMPFLFSRKLLIVASFLLAFFLTFAFVDFRVSSWLLMLSTMYVLGNRNWRQLLWVPVAVSSVIYLIFRYLFEVILPVWT
jgi:uncharacterized membrane protein YeiH